MHVDWGWYGVKCSAFIRLYCLSVEIWNKRSVVYANKGHVKCYLHVNSLLCGCIVYDLSLQTKYRLPLERGLTNTAQKRGEHFAVTLALLSYLLGHTVFKLYICRSSRVTVFIVMKLQDRVSQKVFKSFSLVVFQKSLFQWSHTRPIQSSCVISHCSGKGRLLATF